MSLRRNLTQIALFRLLGSETSVSIGQTDVEFCSTFNNSLTLHGGHIVCNFSTVCPVVHHQQLQIFDIRNDNLLESIWQNVSSLLVSSVSNVGHDDSASFKLSTDTRINTLRATPALRHSDLSIRLVALEAIMLALVHILDLLEWLHHGEYPWQK